MSVKFTAKHRKILDEAIAFMRMNVVVRPDNKIVLDGSMILDLENETAEIPSDMQWKLNQLKKNYSYCALKSVAKTNLWMTKGTSRDEGQIVKF